MEIFGGVSPSTAAEYVAWEELLIPSSKDGGMKVVRFYLKRRDGSLDLAVVGKEKKDKKERKEMTLRRSTRFHFAIQNRFLGDFTSSSIKLRSLKEVHDWLNSFVSDDQKLSASKMCGRLDGKDFSHKDALYQKLGQNTGEFLWLGSPWSCKKRRRHYPSFRRNGVTILVNDFVYVLAEDGKRLVAYLEDMYEDSWGKNMVKIRWFHRFDEVGINLPDKYSGREIFFSLCDQDLSIECIDGLATVLSPQHFKMFLNEAKDTQLAPFVCFRLFDNDELQPFDITQIKGYWNQEILRYMHITLAKDSGNSVLPDYSVKSKCQNDGFSTMKPRKRLRLSRDRKAEPQCGFRKDSGEASPCLNAGMAVLSGYNNDCTYGVGGSVAPLLNKETNVVQPPCLAVGSQIELLSQDSGLRGCWFRASVIKKNKTNEKIKVQYLDLRNADDETRNLEEWVLASRVAAGDALGLRLDGRMTIRPSRLAPNSSKVSWLIDVGYLVDVWWHDGWWEGIVIQKESDDKFRVHFPGEKQDCVFSRSDLRHSQEWLKNNWKDLIPRPEVAASILSGLKSGLGVRKTPTEKYTEVSICAKTPPESKEHKESLLHGSDSGDSPTRSCLLNEDNGKDEILDLSKDDFLAQLKWTSRKRRRGGGVIQKLPWSPKMVRSWSSRDNSSRPSPMKVDRDKCKFISDSVFKSSAVPPMTSLVMSR